MSQERFTFELSWNQEVPRKIFIRIGKIRLTIWYGMYTLSKESIIARNQNKSKRKKNKEAESRNKR